jgi:hypothetical protein
MGTSGSVMGGGAGLYTTMRIEAGIKCGVFTAVVRVQIPLGGPDAGVENQPRRVRAGSVRVARHVGKKHASNDAIVMIASADPNASGSRGLTL